MHRFPLVERLDFSLGLINKQGRMEESRLSRTYNLLSTAGRTIVGERWVVNPPRSFVAGAATASVIVFAVFLFWVFNTGRHEPIRYFSRVKTGMMYGLWLGVLAVYLLLLGYTDSTYFSGKATRWWQVASRTVVVIIALVNMSQWFWSAWVAVVAGTPTLGVLATMGYWKYLFLFNPTGKWGGLYALVMIPVSWYLPYLLIQEFDAGRWKLPALLGSPVALAIALLYYQIGPPALPFILTVVAMFLPMLKDLHWRIKRENVPTGDPSGGTTRRIIGHRPFVYYSFGTAIGLVAITGFVISLYPISSSQTPLLLFMKASLVLTLVSIVTGVRVLRGIQE